LYAQIEYGDLVLTSENGIAVLDRVVLEPQVWEALLDYVRHVNQQNDQITGESNV
jgi:hypothetical protein